MFFPREFKYEDWILSYQMQRTLAKIKGAFLDEWNEDNVIYNWLPAVPVPTPTKLEWLENKKIEGSWWSIYRKEAEIYDLSDSHTMYSTPLSRYCRINLQHQPAIESAIRKASNDGNCLWVTSCYFDGKAIQNTSISYEEDAEPIGGVYVGSQKEPKERYCDPYKIISRNKKLFSLIEDTEN